jgi:hypothetical protein
MERLAAARVMEPAVGGEVEGHAHALGDVLGTAPAAAAPSFRRLRGDESRLFGVRLR